MTNIVSLPRAFAPPLNEEGLPKSEFEGVKGSSASVVHSPDGDVSFLIANPFHQAVAILTPAMAREFARAVLAAADEAEHGEAPDFPPMGGAA